MRFFEQMNDVMAKAEGVAGSGSFKWHKGTVIAAAVMFAFFLFSAVTASVQVSEWTKLMQNGTTVQATLSVKDKSSLAVQGYRISYAYTVAGKAYDTVLTMDQTGYESLGGANAQTVYYDAANPAVIATPQAIAAAQAQRGSMVGGSVIMGTLTLLLLGARLMTRKKKAPTA